MTTGPVAFRAGQRETLSVTTGPLSSAHFAGPSVLLADVSEFQPAIADPVYLAWSKAIIIRAAYGDQHDDLAWYGGARRDALHAGGVRFLGIYQYIVAGQDPVAQAQAMGRLIGKLRPGEKIIADIEEGSGSQQTRWQAWAGEIHRLLGDVPWSYSGLNFSLAHGLYAVNWVAAYQAAEPSVPHLLWQFTDAFTVPGVGTCDCSVFRGTIDQLAALAYQGAPVALTQAEITSIADAVWQHQVMQPGGSGSTSTAAHVLADNGNQIRAGNAAAAALGAKLGVQLSGEAATVAAAVLAALDPASIASVIATALGPDVGHQVLTELSAQLAKP